MTRVRHSAAHPGMAFPMFAGDSTPWTVGEVREVAPDLAARIVADHPGFFEVVEEAPAPKPTKRGK